MNALLNACRRHFNAPLSTALFVLAWAFVVLSAWTTPGLSRAQAQTPDANISVDLERRGEVVHVDASLVVSVDIQLAWQVMTDYEGMPEFLPQLQSSRIVSRNGNRLRLEQAGRVFLGPIPWTFEYVRDVELTAPTRIRSVIVGGSLASGEVVTELKRQGGATHISYRSEAVPGVWVPLGISEGVIRQQVLEQLAQMRAEMLRRQGTR